MINFKLKTVIGCHNQSFFNTVKSFSKINPNLVRKNKCKVAGQELSKICKSIIKLLMEIGMTMNTSNFH